MYSIKVDGISNFECKVHNYDDAMTIASVLVDFGKVTKGEYETVDGKYVRVGEKTLNATITISLID